MNTFDRPTIFPGVSRGQLFIEGYWREQAAFDFVRRKLETARGNYAMWATLSYSQREALSSIVRDIRDAGLLLHVGAAK